MLFVVDDMEQQRIMAGEMLAKLNYSTSAAENGEAENLPLKNS